MLLRKMIMVIYVKLFMFAEIVISFINKWAMVVIDAFKFVKTVLIH